MPSRHIHLNMIKVKEALKQILDNFFPLGTEKVNLCDSLNRVLAEDIFAVRNIPPKDNSAMDGYALRFEDTLGATAETPVTLSVIEDVPAGRMPIRKVGAGKATRIMTGALVPQGANAIIRVEDTKKDGKHVLIFDEASPGMYIRKTGEDVHEHELVIARGTVIRAAEIGMMAAVGKTFISVYQKPLVAILTTGDELVDIDEFPATWQSISSNTYSIAAQVMECGAIPMNIGIARDNRKDLIAKFMAALRADIIISSGGVSVGDYDLVKDVIHEVGNGLLFWRVAMKPGKPLAFGIMEGVPLFGLPGNPVSSMISFEQFVRPSLLKMMGHRNIYRKSVKATLLEDVNKAEGLTQFIRAVVTLDDGKYLARITGEQGSGILKSMVLANGLIVLPEDATLVKAGEIVTVQLIDNSLAQTIEPDYL